MKTANYLTSKVAFYVQMRKNVAGLSEDRLKPQGLLFLIYNVLFVNWIYC